MHALQSLLYLTFLYAILLSKQNEAEAAFTENDELKKSFEVAEKAQEDLNQKSKMTEVFTRFLFSFITHYFLYTLSHCSFYKEKKSLSDILYCNSSDQSAGAQGRANY